MCFRISLNSEKEFTPSQIEAAAQKISGVAIERLADFKNVTNVCDCVRYPWDMQLKGYPVELLLTLLVSEESVKGVKSSLCAPPSYSRTPKQLSRVFWCFQKFLRELGGNIEKEWKDIEKG